MFYDIFGEDAKTLDTAIALGSLANLFRIQRDFGQAHDHYMRALGMLFHIFGQEANNSHIAETLHNIGILEQDKDQYNNARVYHEKALQMMVGAMGNDASTHPLVRKIAHELIKIENLGEKSDRGKCWMPSVTKKRQVVYRRHLSNQGDFFSKKIITTL